MTVTRRSLLRAGLALSVIPNLVRADLALGSGTLTTVSDGNLVLPGDFVFDTMPQAELAPILSDFGLSRDRLAPECNLALYRDGRNTVLFDAGSGPDFMPTAGSVVESLDALGIAARDVTHVVFTHAHPDHIWGLLDDFDEPLFSEATCMMGRDEWDYWWDPATVETIGEARMAMAVGAKRRMEAIEDAVVLFDGDTEILPGISALSTPGHTPGHMAFELRNGGASALVVGDAIGNHHVALRRPDWPSGADQDPAGAALSRRMLIERIVAEQLAVVGFHLPEGGMGRIEAAGEGYRFLPGEV